MVRELNKMYHFCQPIAANRDGFGRKVLCKNNY